MPDTHVIVLFTAVILGLLSIDLFFINRKGKAVSYRQAIFMTGFWMTLSLGFGAWVWWTHGSTKGLEFFTGYVIEYALSVDNIFVFIMLFGFFRVPEPQQHRVLFWGIIGALLMRGIMIVTGAALIERFDWLLYLFGAFLVITGVKMLLHKEEGEKDLSKNVILKFFRRVLPLSEEYHGNHFLTIKAGRRLFTPLFLVLIMVEITDLVFAVDSIPAVFAVTTDPFIVFTSNVCAILGLRSLYFLLAGAMTEFKYLKVGLALVLLFVGLKMLLKIWLHLPISFALLIVVALLLGSILASIRARKQAA